MQAPERFIARFRYPTRVWVRITGDGDAILLVGPMSYFAAGQFIAIVDGEIYRFPDKGEQRIVLAEIVPVKSLVTDPLREALEGIVYANHPGESSSGACLCGDHEEARAALDAAIDSAEASWHEGIVGDECWTCGGPCGHIDGTRAARDSAGAGLREAAQRLVDVIFAEAQAEPFVLPLRGMRAASDLRAALSAPQEET